MSMRYYIICISGLEYTGFFVLPQSDIIDCEISSLYPVGFTNCHSHQFRDNIALVDCGNDLTSITIIVCVQDIVSFVLWARDFTIQN